MSHDGSGHSHCGGPLGSTYPPCRRALFYRNTNALLALTTDFVMMLLDAYDDGLQAHERGCALTTWMTYDISLTSFETVNP